MCGYVYHSVCFCGGRCVFLCNEVYPFVQAGEWICAPDRRNKNQDAMGVPLGKIVINVVLLLIVNFLRSRLEGNLEFRDLYKAAKVSEFVQ